MNLKKILYLTACLPALGASAHTVLLEENFNDDYTVNFPVMIEADHHHPVANLQSLFMDSNGVMRPWRKLKDISTSLDGYITSHSYYSPEGQSNDWLCSRAVEIPGKGFELSFGAQSIGFRSPARRSSLWIFITDSPVTNEKELPSEPTWVIEDLTFGDDQNNAYGDFETFTFSLDRWAGQTIYLNFANLNEDRDLLAIDDVVIHRLDPADLSVESMPLAVAGEYTLGTDITCTAGMGLPDWEINAIFSNGQTFSQQGGSLAPGESVHFEIPFSIEADERLLYTVALSSSIMEDTFVDGEVQGMAFLPTHRVLMEESTGLWCGNCPMGQYTIESMMLDPDMNDKVVPVSVHVPSSAHANYLVVSDYATPLGLTVAPAFRLDREFVAMTFSTEHDLKYNPADPESTAGTVLERSRRMTIMDINADAEFAIQNGDTTAIKVKATVIPAYTMRPDDVYAVGFVLTENNVWLKQHISWAQENYLSGFQTDSEIGGWVKLPPKVYNARLQDVARAIDGYTGIDGSLPAGMEMNREYTFEREIRIPDTYQESNGKVNAPAIVAANCGIVAFIIDRATNTVVNAAYHPMTEQTEKRFTTADLVGQSAVEEPAPCDDHTETEYYSLDGLKVKDPIKGSLYIARKGSKVNKIVY